MWEESGVVDKICGSVEIIFKKHLKLESIIKQAEQAAQKAK